MNVKIGFELLAAFIGQLLGLQGRTKEQSILNKIMAAYRAGQNVDAHMRKIADQLEADEPIDWDEFEARLNAESTAFQSRGKPE